MPKKFSDYLAVLSGLVQACGGSLERIITGACCDSRQCQPGFLFCAMQGERQDGHQFIEQALHLGAAAVLSEKEVTLPTGVPWVAVHNAYPAFARIAELAADYPARSLKLLGITGTNGKTTSAYLLRDILTVAGLRTGMIGTVEYDLGGGNCRQAERTTPTPFQLQQLFVEMKKHGVEYVVLEVSSHALAQERLGSAQFDGAIFTNLTRDHLDYHGDFESYFQCKKKLFSELLLPGRPMLINADDSWGKRLLAEVRGRKLLAFSLQGDPEAAIQLRDLYQDENHSSFTLHFPDQVWHLTSPLTGLYNAYNLTAAASLAYGLEIPEDAVRQALQQCHGAPGRLQRFTDESGLIVFVDYAHTDDAIKNALAALRPLCKGRLFVIFGCGGNRDHTKRPLMAEAAEKGADQIVVTSDNPRFEEPETIINDIIKGFAKPERIIIQPDREKAIRETIACAQPQDMILLAGKGHEDYQEIKGIKYPLNDAEIVARCLSGRECS